MEPAVLELFGGAGGMALGFDRAGFVHKIAIEMDPVACSTLRANFPGLDVRQARVEDVDLSGIDDVDVVIGGPPCQPFSLAGKARGQYDPRDGLPAAMAVVSALRPRAFVFENVAGLTRVAFAGYLAQVKSDLAELGYRVESHVLDAAHYGVPQFRRRLFIVGLRSDLAGRLRWPYPTHSNPGRPMPGTLPWLTVRQALAGLEAEYVVDRAVSAATASKHPAMLLDEPAGAIRSGGDGHSHPHQYVAMSNGLGRADPVEPDEPARTVLARTSKDSHDLTGWVEAGRQVRRGQRKQGGPRKEDLILGLDEPAPAQFGLAQGRNNVPVAEGGKAWDTSQSQSQRLLDLDEPAFTISSMGNGKTGVRAPRMAGDDHESIHGVRYRRLNWRECAALQAFPPDWKFQGSDTDRYRQIGNALPPPLAQAVAAAVLAALVD